MDFPQRPPGEGSVPLIFLPSDSALPATTNAQKLGCSDTSKLSPSPFEMVPLKPKKRKSDDDINRGTKRNKEEKLTPQVLCDKIKPELDSGKDNPDVGASFPSAMADYQKRLQSSLSGIPDDSSGPSSPAIADVDKISVDSQDVGVDDSTVAELLKQLKVRPNSNEMGVLRDLYPDYDPTTVQNFSEIQSAMEGWLALAEKLKETEETWEAQIIITKLLKSINNTGYNISKVLKDGKEFDMYTQLNHMVDSSQSQSTMVKQHRLFDFDILLRKFERLREVVEEASIQWLRNGRCDIGDIMTKLKEARSVIPDAAPLKGIPTRLDPRAKDVPAHKHDRISPNNKLQNAINSKLEREKEKDEVENDKDAVFLWKLVANSLSTMQSVKLEHDDSDADILNLAVGYMSKIQPDHGSEGPLPGIDFIAFQNEKNELGIKVVPLRQMVRLLSGIPDAEVVAFFILSYLPEEYHALLSCTTIFTEEHTPVWRGHVLFEEWSEEESGAFAYEFSRLVTRSWAIKSALQKWHGLLEVLNPIIIRIFLSVAFEVGFTII